MNSCVLMAEIIKDPELRYTQDGQTPIAEMLVQFPGLRAEDPSQTLKVVGWGNLAQQIQEQFHQGDHVVIEGRLGMNTIDRPEGFKEKRAELTVSRIHAVETSASFGGNTGGSEQPANSQRPSPPAASGAAYRVEKQQETAKATGAFETNYDDIPF